jgi:hypothetical protein
MGIRTPGEKTAFEVQALENAAGRIFQQKIERFEKQFVEPMLNQFFEAARRNLVGVESVKVLDEDLAIVEFLNIKPADLNQKGKLYPIGARLYAKQNRVIQNLLGFISSPAYQDASVATHISGLKIAKLFEEYLGLESFELVEENVRVMENLQTQKMLQSAQQEAVEDVQERAGAEDAIAEAEAEEAV